MQGLITYGKLMNPNFGKHVYGSKGHKIILKGFKREWNVPDYKNSKFGLLGVVEADAEIQAVLYVVNKNRIKESDKYEYRYVRVRVDTAQINLIDKADLPDVVWIYMPKKAHKSLTPKPKYLSDIKKIYEKLGFVSNDLAQKGNKGKL